MNKDKSVSAQIMRPAIVLTVIALITTCLLAVTNAFTKTRIADLQAQMLRQTRQEVLPTAVRFSDEKTAVVDAQEVTYVEGLDQSGRIVGYVFQNASAGYGGEVTVLSGIDREGVITGVKPMNLAETPNLGMRASEEAFRTQYIGKKGEIKVSKQAASDSEILAISGATITSNAFTRSVNAALLQFKSIVGSPSVAGSEVTTGGAK